MADNEDPNGSEAPRYVNLAQLRFTPNEFFLDLAHLFPPASTGNPVPNGTANGTWVGRYVMTPSHAKRLLAALSSNIEKYEDENGAIDAGREQNPTGIILN